MNEDLHKTLTFDDFSVKLRRSYSDESLYIDDDLIVAVYIDNLLILSSNLDTIKEIKAYLIARYKMKNVGEAIRFLGINIYRDRTNRRIRLK